MKVGDLVKFNKNTSGWGTFGIVLELNVCRNGFKGAVSVLRNIDSTIQNISPNFLEVINESR